MTGMTAAELAKLVENISQPPDGSLEGVKYLEVRVATARIATEKEVPPERLHDFIDTYKRFADVFEIPAQAHEAIAIALVAAAANSRVWIEVGGKTLSLDCWTLIITSSGGGRNTAVSKASEVLRESGLDSLLHNVQWGSEPAVKQDFAEHPCGLFVWPEMSEVLQDLNRPHLAGVKQWVTNLYDETTLPPSKIYRRVPGKTNTPPIDFTQAPRTSFIGTSSYEWLIPNLNRVDASGGFLARWMIVFAPDIKKRIALPRKSEPALMQPLVLRLQEISKLEGKADLSKVVDLYEKWYGETADRFDNHSSRALAVAFWNRHRDHVLKLAVIFEMSKSGSLDVTVASMRRAIWYAGQLETGLFKLLETGLDAEGYELTRMIDFVRKDGVEGVPFSKLTRAFKNVDGALRHKRVRTLLDSGEMYPFLRSTLGRNLGLYVHKDYRDEHKQKYPEDKEKEV